MPLLTRRWTPTSAIQHRTQEAIQPPFVKGFVVLTYPIIPYVRINPAFLWSAPRAVVTLAIFKREAPVMRRVIVQQGLHVLRDVAPAASVGVCAAQAIQVLAAPKQAVLALGALPQVCKHFSASVDKRGSAPSSTWKPANSAKRVMSSMKMEARIAARRAVWALAELAMNPRTAKRATIVWAPSSKPAFAFAASTGKMSAMVEPVLFPQGFPMALDIAAKRIR